MEKKLMHESFVQVEPEQQSRKIETAWIRKSRESVAREKESVTRSVMHAGARFVTASQTGAKKGESNGLISVGITPNVGFQRATSQLP